MQSIHLGYEEGEEPSAECALEIDGARHPIPRELALRMLAVSELVTQAEGAS